MIKNREQWLTEICLALEPLFAAKGYGLKSKPYRITCGWPCRFATSITQRRVGECHSIESSAGGVSEIFISPAIADSLEVAGVVCHELIHVAVGNKAGHKGPFKAAMKYIGLGGKPTCAMPGADLNDTIRKILKSVGNYPHSPLKGIPKLAAKSSSVVKLECPDCGCIVRMSKKWLTDAAEPVCACGGLFGMPEDKD